MPAAPVTTASLVLIHGEDDFAVAQRGHELYQQWSAELGGFDHETIDAQTANSGEALRALRRLREALQTLPFFGSGKAIWFQNCTFLADDRTSSSKDVTDSLQDLAQDLKEFPFDNVRLLITAGKVDRRKTFFKTVEKIGTVETHAAWSDDKDWTQKAESLALARLRQRRKEIGGEALAALVQNVGPHSRQLANEVEKLTLYLGERTEVEERDVVAVVTRNKQAQAFALADALGRRDLPELLRRLDEELWEMRCERDKSEIGLLYGLITKMRALLFLKEMIREGWIKAGSHYGAFKAQLEHVPADRLPQDKKFNPLAMHPFVLHKALEQAKNYTTEELIRAMDLLLRCNLRLVSSGVEGGLILQQTLVDIVRQPGAGLPTAAAAG